MRVSVIGGGAITDEQAARAEAVGRELGARGHTVVCGGRGGTMEAVCRGAKRAGGTTIGILPSDRREQANNHVDVPIATGMGHARNALVALNGDAVIALEGGVGTLTEIGFAGIYGRPVVGLETHDVSAVGVGIDLETVETPEAAVDAVEFALESDTATDDGTDAAAEDESPIPADDPYTIREEVPDPETFAALREAANLPPRSPEGIERGLPNSLHGAVAVHEPTGDVVGMGRVVGDGGTVYQITDMAVHPDHQRRGLGTRLMERLEAYIAETAPPRAYVNLIADIDGFYEQFGFEGVQPASKGMFRRTE